MLEPLNEHSTDKLVYLSKYTPIRVSVNDTLGKEPVYLVDENPKFNEDVFDAKK